MTPVFAMLFREVNGEQVPIARVLGVVTLDEAGEIESFASEATEDMELAETVEILGRAYNKRELVPDEFIVETQEGESMERARASTKTIYLNR